MPTSRDMAIFVLTTTTTQPITLPLAHARGVIRLRYSNNNNNLQSSMHAEVISHYVSLEL